VTSAPAAAQSVQTTVETQVQVVREAAEEVRRNADLVRRMADEQVRIATPVQVTSGGGSGAYSSGLSALQRGEYDRAIAQFDRAITAGDARADGALYWKAFAQLRAGRGPDAITTLSELRRSHGQSSYLPDASALDTEARRANRPTPTSEDDEIKLLALQGIARSGDAVPVVEGVIKGVNSLNVKKRALSVLAQVTDPRARALLTSCAKGACNTDLQIEAVRLLGSRREPPAPAADFVEIYGKSRDAAVKSSALSALAAQGHADALVTLARGETALEPRREIIRRLSDMAPNSKAAADFLMGVLK
jgi:hypothetical protein